MDGFHFLLQFGEGSGNNWMMHEIRERGYDGSAMMHNTLFYNSRCPTQSEGGPHYLEIPFMSFSLHSFCVQLHIIPTMSSKLRV
jgi:hypothetical protein